MGAYTVASKALVATPARAGARALPAAARAHRTAGGHAVGRRAADARDRPGADGAARASSCSTSRAWAWRRSSCARSSGDRAHQPRGRRLDPPRRAERAHGPLARAPRLRARDRAHRPRGAAARRSSRTRRCGRRTWGPDERAPRRRPPVGRPRLGHLPRDRRARRVRGARALGRLRPAPPRRARGRAPRRHGAPRREPPRREGRPPVARRQRADLGRDRGAEGPRARGDRPRHPRELRARAQHGDAVASPRPRPRCSTPTRSTSASTRSTRRATPTAGRSSSRRSAPSPASGTKRGVEGRPFDVRAPLLALSKAGIAKLALSLGVPVAETLSCYDPLPARSPAGPAVHCGRCDACLLRRKGFREAGLADPTTYEG